jgi:uncharacterized protein YjbI with pentapeptide repeats
MKHQIKNRYTGDVLFECELPAHTPSGLAMRHTLEKAIQNKANLQGADLQGADLRWANLQGADLQGADLRWANLQEANLQRANLQRANLQRADLRWANLQEANLQEANLQRADLQRADLRWADLRWANLRWAKLQEANLQRADLRGADLQDGNLIGDRPLFQIGPIGSRHDYFTAWITDQGLKLQSGCFFGTVEEFTAKLSTTHADNDHAKEYQMALMMIEAHACIWTPKEQSK